MDLLCIDIGNTSVHYGKVSDNLVTETGDFPTARLMEKPALLASELHPLLGCAEGVSYCSVVPEANEIVNKLLSEYIGGIFHLTYNSCPGLELVYPKPEEIGEDRIANAIAAQELYSAPAIVIDMGTAVTFDIISSKGYEGGIIAPGLRVMTEYLHEQTALLPRLKESDLIQVEGAIGKSTVHAMQIGVSVGFSGMIEALLKRIEAELLSQESKKPIVLSTGGSIANLTSDWSSRTQFVENLTLLGLSIAYRRSNPD